MFDRLFYLDKTRELHFKVRDVVKNQQAKFSMLDLSQVVGQGSGDVSYKIDIGAEKLIDEFFAEFERPVVVVSEASGRTTFPEETKEGECEAVVIMDPIDGSRPLMYDLDSAFVLTGIVPYNGTNTDLRDIQIAVQTEVPTTKARFADQLWAEKGSGAVLERVDLAFGEQRRLTPQPSRAETIEHGFAMLAKYFPGGKDIIAQVEEELFRATLGPVQKDKALAFDHQYISSAGAFYRMMMGSYRFFGDIRPWLDPILARRGSVLGLCAHPYDVSTKLIADEVGVVTTDLNGNDLNCPLDTKTNVGFLTYANQNIRKEVEGPLLAAMEKVKARHF